MAITGGNHEIRARSAVTPAQPSLRVTVSAETSASPAQVLAAARDFSGRREQIWPNVRAALDWIDHLSAKLERGYVLALDYGFPRDEFYAPYRPAGTLQVREKHRHLASPFEQIGHADITAHVNWTNLAERAESHGLRVAGFTDQHHFVTGIISEFPELVENQKTKRALQTLLHPEMLGRAFQVLALNKNVDLAAPLAGFKFAREPRAALGIC